MNLDAVSILMIVGLLAISLMAFLSHLIKRHIRWLWSINERMEQAEKTNELLEKLVLLQMNNSQPNAPQPSPQPQRKASPLTQRRSL